MERTTAIQALRSIALFAGIGRFRHRVVSATAPRMATRQPPQTHGRSVHRAMPPHRLQTILRATGLEPASACSSAQCPQKRRHRPLVNADEENQQGARHIYKLRGRRNSSRLQVILMPFVLACCGVHREPDKIGSRRARINHSSRNSEKVAPAAAGLATTTISQPGASVARCNRQISRNLRRIRLRITAPPTRLEVMSPNRDPPPAGSFAAFKRKSRPCTERPSERTKANSRLNRMRA